MKRNRNINVIPMDTNGITTVISQYNKMKNIGLIVLLLLLQFSSNKLYASYCNNPSGVTMTRNGTSATLSWTGNGSSYYYWCVTTSSTFNSGSWPGAGSVKNGYTSGSTSVTVSGLSATGTLYAYVAGVNSSWEWCAPASNVSGSPAPPPAPPCTGAGTPGSLSAYASGTSAASMSWSASSGTAPITYYWSCNGSSGNTTGTSASVSGLSANTSYTFSVYASNSCGTSATATSGSFKTYPDAPSSPTASPSTICSGQGTALSASNVQGTIYWYSGSCGGTLAGTGNSLTVYPTSTTTYYARNNNGNWSGSCSSGVTVTVNDPATMPSTAICSNTTKNSADLSWGISTGTGTITYYWVVGTSASVVYGSGTAQGSTTSTSAIATGLTASTGYYLRVYASTPSPCGASSYQSSSMFTTKTLPPVADAATNIRANSFTANWATTTGATKYYFDLSTSSDFSSYVTGYNNKDIGNVTSYSISGLNRLTTYYYRLRGYNAGGSSENSNTISFTTLPLNNFLIEKVGGGNIGTQMAGQAFNVRITARDAENTTVTDYTGSSAVALTTNSVLTSGGTTANFVAGILASHSVTLTLSGASKTLTASKTDGVTSVTSTSTTFTVTPAALDHFTLAVDGTITAGTPFTVTATAYDVYNNIKTNYGGASNILNYTGANSVNWTTTATSSPKGTARIIAANGNQTFTNGVSAGITGFTFFNSDQSQLAPNISPTLTITDGLTAKLGTTSPIIVLNAPLDNFKVIAGITQIAGTPFTVTVTARDEYLNTCVDYNGSIRFKSSDDALVAFPSGLQSFAPAATYRGVKVYSNEININTIGAYWLRAADSQFAYKSGEQQNIVVRPGAFLKSAPISIITIDSSSKIAGEEVVVTLTPRDAQGNLLYACQDISVLLDGVVKSGTHQVAHGTEIGSDGVYVFHVPVTSTTAVNLISAKLGAVPFDQTYDITVTPAPPSLAHTIITPDAGTMSTDGNQTVTVQLKDEFDNLRTTNDGEVTLTTTLGGFGGNNGSQTVTAVYNGTTSGSYSATLYASYSASNHGVGTAAITGSVAFNATPGPGVWSGSSWPSNGSISDGASVTVTEGLPSLATSTLVTDKSTMSTNGTATLTLQLKDHLGNLIANNRGAVTLVSDRGVLTNLGYLSAGRYTATLTAGTTAVNGVGLATISGSFAGTGTASAITGNFNDDVSLTANTITTVDITEGLPAVASIDISTAANQITADDLTTGGQTIVTVQLKDALGNLIVNDRGSITLSTNLGVIDNGTTTSPTNITANYTSDGKYTATFKMNGIGVGNATITGKYDGAAISDNAIVTVINGIATQLAISTPPAQSHQPIAGIAFNAQPVIHIKDYYGNLVVTGTGSTDVVTATRITSGTAVLQGTTAKTAVAGVATFTNLSYNVAESIYIQFTSGTLTNTTSAAIDVVHNVPSYLVITGTATQTAGVAQDITIRAYDAYNNPANRFAGSKTLTFSGANQSPETSSFPKVNGTTFGTATSITFTGGEATASMILYKEETVDIAANFTIGSYVDPAGYTSSAPVNINAASGNRLHVVVSQTLPSYLAITGNATQVAGATQTITITAYDSFNNPATGYSGEKTLRFSGANVSLVPSTNPTVGGVDMGNDKVLTFTNGVATASMALYKVENISVMATDQAVSGITTPAGYKLAVNVTHAVANYYAVTGNGTQTAGASQNITVTAYDAFNNKATTYAGDVAVTFSGANPSPNTPNAATNPTVQNKTGVATNFGTPTTITFAGGTATRSMTLYKVETANIVATAGSITTPEITGYDYRLQVAVNHAANSYFAITGSSTQTAGVSQNITLTMYDAYNNIATNYAGTQSLTFSGANPSPNTPNAATNPIVNSTALGSATSLNFVAGTVSTTMNLYKVETALITATNGTQTANSHKLSVNVSHADQNYMTITGSGTQTAGISQDVTITAYDAFNNVATRFDGSKSLTFSGASVSNSNSPTTSTSPIVSGTSFGASTSLVFASGVVTTSMNLYKVETASVTATNTDEAITITSDAHKLSVVVSHATPAYLAVTGNSTQIAGVAQNITLTAYDAYNNVATSYSGAKSLTFSGANDAATSPITHPTLGGTAFGTPKTLSFTSGVASGSMILYKTETALISANDGTINANSSASFDHRLSVLMTPTLLKDFLVYNVPDPNDLGTWQPVTVEPRDTYNNRKTNYVGKITFSNTDIYADNPLDYQFLLSDAGIHHFDNTAGNRGVKFSQTGLDWWLTAMDLAEPAKYGYQSGITVQRAVTITANDRTKTYGDALTMGTSEFTIVDIISGLTPIDHGITGVTLTSSGSAATATVAGSQYTITPSAATGTYTAGLYRIVYSNAGRLTVNKRNLTLSTFLASAKTYDGTTAVTGTGFSDNRVNSDALTFDYSAVFASKHAGAAKSVNYTGISISGGAGSNNYTLVTTSGTASATISQRPVNVTAVTDTKIYDGSNSSDELPVVGNLQTGDLVTNVGTQQFDNANAGTSKVLTPAGTVISDGNSGANYAVSYVTSSTGVITQKELTVVNAAVTTKIYDGNTTAAITGATLSGTVGSDDVVLGNKTSGTFASALVGTYSATTAPMTISGTKAANYSLTQPILSGEITTKELTVINAAVTTKVYDGNTEAAITGATLSGIVGSDDVVLGNKTSGTLASASVGTHSMTTTPMTISGTKANNYSLTQPILSGEITAKPITGNFTADNKVYDRNVTATVLTRSLNGVVAIDAGMVSLSGGTATFTNSNVAIGITVTASGMTLSGTKAGNYSLTSVGTTTATITTLTIAGNFTVTASKEYDQNTSATVLTRTLTGVLGADDVTLTGGTASYNNKNVGIAKTVTLSGMSLSGAQIGNYSLNMATTSADITPKTLHLSNFGADSKYYDGTTTATGIGFTDDRIAGDNLSFGREATFESASVGDNKNVNYSNIAITGGLDKNNYVLASTTGVAKADIWAGVGQSIALTTGWNIISFDIVPINQNMLSVLQPLINEGSLLKVMDESGNSIENVGGWINDIGNSNTTEGYKVKVSRNTTLDVNGTQITLPIDIPLTSGWNIISFPDSNPQESIALLQTLMNSGNLIKVMDESGNAIEKIGDNWISDISYFVPGEGYKIKVTGTTSLTINSAPRSAIILPNKTLVSTSFSTVFKGNGYDHMNVYLLDLAASGIRLGDELGVFDGKYCVGTIRIDQQQMTAGIVNIPVSCNDGLTGTINGFTKGNKLSLRINRDGVESNLGYDVVYGSTDHFMSGSSSFLKASVIGTTGIDEIANESNMKCYPNPFADELSIELDIPFGTSMHVEIIDVMGRKISDIYSGQSNGFNLIKWNGTSAQGATVKPGVYFVRCNGQVSQGIIKK